MEKGRRSGFDCIVGGSRTPPGSRVEKGSTTGEQCEKQRGGAGGLDLIVGEAGLDLIVGGAGA